MSEVPRFLVPLTADLPDGSVPTDLVAHETAEGSVLDLVYRGTLTVRGDANYLRIEAALVLLGEVTLPLLPADAIALVLGATPEDSGDAGTIALRFQLGTPPPDANEDDRLALMERALDEGAAEVEVPPEPGEGFEEEDAPLVVPSSPAGPLPWRVELVVDALRLRFSRELLIPVEIDAATGEVTPKDGHVHIGLALGLRVDSDGNFEFGVGELPVADAEPEEPGAPTVALRVSDSFQIGTSRVTVTLGELYLRFSTNTPPPSWTPDDLGAGVYVRELSVRLPPDIGVGIIETVGAEDVVIATGGFSGAFFAAWTPRLVEAAEGRPVRFEGAGTGDLFGMPFALKRLAFRVRQNSFAEATLEAHLIPPVIDKPLGLTLSVDAEGRFAAEVSASDLLPPDADRSLVRLRQEGLLELTISSARFELADEVGTFVLAGTLKPLVGGIDWPRLELQKLSINTRGEIDLEGGWIDVPETFSLDFHAFKIELDRVGFGTEGEGESERHWVGLSGGIRLIEGIPLSASVEGLKVSWRPQRDPTLPHDPDVQVSIEGIAVSLEIPGTLKLDGAVRYRELPKPRATLRDGETPPAETEGSLFYGHIFTGSISLEITALNTAVAGELLIGELTPYRYEGRTRVDGHPFTALFIVLSVELPTAIPLGATGAGLYGLKGLFGMHVAPDRHLDEEGEPESWYLWYKADRGQSSGYNVTKVVKWGPRVDNFAFGAGVKLGTVYDDGFTINAGVLAAILIPGPVVMIEGRANLLKQRSESARGMEGALYALIVFDGIARTFQMNVDVNFAMEDVITVAGGMAAFFHFDDGDAWYIHVGRKELPKRIRADILSIITASAYFMIEPVGIQFGAAVGVDLQLQYGPLEIKLIIRLSFDLGIFWKEPQITGAIELYLELTIRIFGIGISLILLAALEASSPQPWFIRGIARAALSLPFPLPSFDVQVEFVWGETGPPAVVDLLKSAAMVHPKLPGAVSWTLPSAAALAELPPEDEWPVVPVDSVPVLSLGKPITNVSLSRNEDGEPRPFAEEPETEGIHFSYVLGDVELWEKAPDAGWRRKLTVPANASRLRLRPDPYAQEPQVELWWYAPLDTYDPTSRRNYVDPCDGAAPPQRHSVDWRDVALETRYPAPFRRGGLTFATSLMNAAVVKRVTPASPADPDRALQAPRIIVRFPQPVSWVEIRTAVSGFRHMAFRDGRAVPLAGTAAQPLGAAPNPTVAIDTLHLDALGGLTEQTGVVHLVSISWITQRDAQASAARAGAGDRGRLTSNLVLEPYRSYRLHATGVRRARRVGEPTAAAAPPQTLVCGFRTGGLPGTDYGAAREAALVAAAPDFADGPLNTVESYVKRTVPPNGAPLFYRGYDVLVELADPYAASMLAPVLSVRVLDRNGRQLVPAPLVRLLTGDLPFVTPGLLAMLSAPREEACSAARVPWTPQAIDRYVACPLPADAPPGRMLRVELLATMPYGTHAVYGFELATSRFRDAIEHLGSGLPRSTPDAAPPGSVPPTRGVQPVRRLGAAAPPPVDWISDVRAADARRRALRATLAAALTVGPHDAGMPADEARAAIDGATRELNDLCGRIYACLDRGGTAVVSESPSRSIASAGIHHLFAAAGLGHRPLPPRAIEVLAIEAGSGFFLLVESPEPLDWTRLTVSREDGGAALPVCWASDGTRAFLFDANATALFPAGAHAVRFSYHRGGPGAPDLDPLYRNGELSADEERVVWDLTL